MMDRRRLLHIALTWGFLAAPSMTSYADGNRQLFPFSASYQLKLDELTFGRVDVELNIDSEGGYLYRADTSTTGLVSIFRSDEVTEISQGTLNLNRVIPAHYSYSHRKPDRQREVNLTFKWDQKRVINKTPESLWSMSIVDGVQDKFSQQLALILDLNRADEPYEYRVADGGRLKHYRYINEGSERISVPAGHYHTIRLIRQKGGRESKASFWMAPELNYLPVQIIRVEGDKRFRMELASISWSQE